MTGKRFFLNLLNIHQGLERARKTRLYTKDGTIKRKHEKLYFKEFNVCYGTDPRDNAKLPFLLINRLRPKTET